MHYHTVAGYTADAGVHCLDCAEQKYNSNDVQYLHNLIDLPEDSEGNQLNPIFAGQLDEFSDGETVTCEDCGAEL